MKGARRTPAAAVRRAPFQGSHSHRPNPRVQGGKGSALSLAQIRDLARGRGGELVVALAPHLAFAVARGPKHHGPCPLCGGSDRFRPLDDFEESGAVYCNQCGRRNGDFWATLRWANGWSFPEAVWAVARYLQTNVGSCPVPSRGLEIVPRPNRSGASKEGRTAVGGMRRKVALRRAWDEAQAIRAGDLVARYLEGRRLDLAGRWPSALRYHREMAVWEQGECLGSFPAMLARVDGSDGRLVGIHRTFLQCDATGKADVVCPKKLMPTPIPGATRGGAVRLFPAESRLCVTEGIETALAVHLLTGAPAWAAISAVGLELFEPPEEATEIVICADHDRNRCGEQAAGRLAKRLVRQGRKVRIALPEHPGTDFADLWALGSKDRGGEGQP